MLKRMDSSRRAKALLDALRKTPMSRGSRLSTSKAGLQDQITGTIDTHDLPPRLAKRVAFQLLLKFDPSDLGDSAVWHAIGQRLHQEVRRLRADIGLVDRQIVVALPKLSPDRIERLLEELQATDPRIARTILNAALDAAKPQAAARRYLDEFHAVVEQLKTIDPDIARTVANATFMARVPHAKAIAHFKQFAEIAIRFKNDVIFFRTVARETFRAKDPLRAAARFIADYDRIVAELISNGTEPEIARTLAAIACMSADPVPSAYKLLQNFEDVLRLAKKSHPSVARSIALSACRASNPLVAARVYMNNYDTIVRLVSITHPSRARKVAAQVFRSDNPVRWARRYLAKLQGSKSSERSAPTL